MELDADVPPEVLRAALIDFGPDRPLNWPGLDASLYELRTVGATWADVKEGTKRPGLHIWSIEHYDWSDPHAVDITVRESNFAAVGSHTLVTISPTPSGGSHVRFDWYRTGVGVRGKVLIALLVLLRGGPITRSFELGVAAIRQRHGGGTRA